MKIIKNISKLLLFIALISFGNKSKAQLIVCDDFSNFPNGNYTNANSIPNIVGNTTGLSLSTNSSSAAQMFHNSGDNYITHNGLLIYDFLNSNHKKITIDVSISSMNPGLLDIHINGIELYSGSNGWPMITENSSSFTNTLAGVTLSYDSVNQTFTFEGNIQTIGLDGYQGFKTNEICIDNTPPNSANNCDNLQYTPNSIFPDTLNSGIIVNLLADSIYSGYIGGNPWEYCGTLQFSFQNNSHKNVTITNNNTTLPHQYWGAYFKIAVNGGTYSGDINFGNNLGAPLTIFPYDLGGGIYLTYDSLTKSVTISGTISDIKVSSCQLGFASVCVDNILAPSPCDDFNTFPVGDYTPSDILPNILNNTVGIEILPSAYYTGYTYSAVDSTKIEYCGNLKFTFADSLPKTVSIDIEYAQTISDITINGIDFFPNPANMPHFVNSISFPTTKAGVHITYDSINEIFTFTGNIKDIMIEACQIVIQEICVDNNVNICHADAQFNWTNTGNNLALFTASNINSNNTYYWTFADGTTANGPIVNHTFLQSGTYYVCLTVIDINDINCADQQCSSVNITSPRIITPNGDGLDDIVSVTCSGSVVYDRNGLVVKVLSQSTNTWDGKNNQGNIVPTGGYTIICNDQSAVIQVTVVR